MGLELSKTPAHLKRLLIPASGVGGAKSGKYFEVLDERHLCETSGCYEKYPLHYAALRANLPEVQQLLSLVYYGSQDCCGRTPLHCVASIVRDEGDPKAVAQLLIDEAAVSENLKQKFVNALDRRKRSALHYAAENEMDGLVALLLENGASPTDTDMQGMTPLHCVAEANSEEAVRCARLLLATDDSQKNAPCKSTRQYIQKNSTPLHIATAEKSHAMVKLLLELDCDVGVVDSEGRTPLHVAVTAGNCRNTVRCVEQLLAKCTPEQASAGTIEGHETALHLAAEYGHQAVLKALLDSEKVDIWALNTDRQTALHCAAMCWIADKSLACAQTLLESDLILENDLHKFTLARDAQLDTALHIACRRQFGRVAELFLTKLPKPWRWLEDDLLSIVYEQVPNAMLNWMDRCFSYKTMDFKDRRLCIEVDFTCITGYVDPLLVPQQETKYLHGVLRAKKWLRNKVLLHPLVQIFIAKKWFRFWWLNLVGLVLQLSWLIVYTLFILEVFALECSWVETEAASDTSEVIPNSTTSTTKGTASGRVICPPYDRPTALIYASILIPLSGIIVAKELFRVVEYDGIRRRLAKWTQWLVLALIIFNLYPIFRETELTSLQYAVAAVGVFLAWAASLRELARLPHFGKYSEVLAKVCKNSFLMLLFYSPILIAFAIAFRILIPGRGQFTFMPVAIVKILIMMIGEFEYEAIFYGRAEEGALPPRVPLAAQLMFVIFVFMATIVLLNLLIGLAVQDPDVQNIIRDAEVNNLSSKLEQIYLMESFLLRIRKGVIGLNSFGRFFSFINVTSKRIAHTSFYATKIVVDEKYYPEGLENEIHQLALAAGTKAPEMY